jgi:oligopeptidase A
MSESNPLLDTKFEIPFDRIMAEHVEPAIALLISEAQGNLDNISALEGERTYANTLGALDHATAKLDTAVAIVRHLEAVATTPEFRSAHNSVQPAIGAFYAGIPLHAGLWKAIKQYEGTPDAGALTGAKRRYLKKTVDSFRRHGADLEGEDKRRLEAIDVELTRQTTKFSENVLDSTNAFELSIADENGLAGLPPSAVEAARASALQKGIEGWRFTLQAPSYTALMTYLDDGKVRERMYRAFNARGFGGAHDNGAITARVLELRRERAALLGFSSFADLVLEDRMAHTGANARRFLEDLRLRTMAHFEFENEELSAFRRELEGAGAPRLEPWDIGYYAEKLRVKLYDFDEEALRPYFPVDRVLSGMFSLVERMFGIEVRERHGVPVWHPDVSYYEIHDGNSGHLGSFYADWFPRETKRGGAWMDAFITGPPHLGFICGNLTPPVGGKPALLTHREVETIFHEFGHLLHHCLSQVEVRNLSGTSVPWDFVELPSQIMENWCWEREALDLFARHYETGAPIPEDLFQKMNRAKTYRAANGQMRQLSLGYMDFALHMDYRADRDGDLVAYSRRILQEFSAVELREDHAMILAFTHLFASPVAYAAGYYSYKWAEVLDADAFTRFKQAGIFSNEVGMDFRSRILARGDSEDPAELYREFMGRDPDVNALLERTGLLDPVPAAR